MDPLTSARVHQSILWPAMVFGLPRQLALLIAVTSLAMVVSLGQVWFLAVTAIALAGARVIAKQDRYIFEIAVAALSVPTVLD